MNPELSDAENLREMERQGIPPGMAREILAIEKGGPGDVIEVPLTKKLRRELERAANARQRK